MVRSGRRNITNGTKTLGTWAYFFYGGKYGRTKIRIFSTSGAYCKPVMTVTASAFFILITVSPDARRNDMRGACSDVSNQRTSNIDARTKISSFKFYPHAEVNTRTKESLTARNTNPRFST